MTGETADISSLCKFEWFQWVWFRDEKALYPEDSRVLGRYLGPSKSIGPAMCMHILKSNSRVIQRTTVGPLTQAKLATDSIKSQLSSFMHATYHGPLGLGMTELDTEDSSDNLLTPTYQPYADNIWGEEPRIPESDSFAINAYAKYIGAQLELPLQDAMQNATVVGCKRNGKGHPIGVSNNDPLLNTRI
jgi:hypothetical protein